MIYAYADETGTNLGHGGGHSVGNGILLTPTEIGRVVVDEALATLAADTSPSSDPKFALLDQATLQRGYFHASEDSHKAHGHFADSIRKNVPSGALIYDYFHPAFRQLPSGAPQDPEELRVLTAMCCMVTALPYQESIQLVIEGRQEFDISKALAWRDDLFKEVERSVYDTPTIPAVFPDVKVGVAGKEVPGLQVADYLIWATNRSLRSVPDPVWSKKAGLKESVKFSSVGGPSQGGTSILGSEIKRPFANYPQINTAIECNGNFEIVSCFVRIERTLRHLSQQTLPIHVAHLTAGLGDLVAKLGLPGGTSTELVQDMASYYIRLFDTLPLYLGIPESDPNWAVLLVTRRMASLVLRGDLLIGVRTCDYICMWRRQQLEQDPGFFNK